MGYREMRKGVWGKPIGFMLFIFKEEENRIIEYFKDIHGIISIWKSETLRILNKTFFIQDLKTFETYGELKYLPSEFEFNYNYFGECI